MNVELCSSISVFLGVLSISFCLVSYLLAVIYLYTENFRVIRCSDYLIRLKKKLNDIAHLI